MKRRQTLQAMLLMMGGAILPSTVGAVPGHVGGRTVIQTRCFDEHQRALCRVLAEMIIPPTDTPGAIQADVPHFLELMVSDWYTDTERNIFFSGLAQLDEHCRNRFQREFLQCDDNQRIDALTHMEKEAGKYRGPTSVAPILPIIDEHQPFFSKLKELTVLGYYTSETGSKLELEYLPMPMEYRDINFDDVGRQWSY